MAGVTLFKYIIFFLTGKERFHTLYFKFHFDFRGKLAHHFFHGIGHILFGIQSGTDSCKKVRVVSVDDMLLVQLEGTDESCFQFR